MKKNIKLVAVAAVAALMIFSCGVTAFAQSVHYTIDSINMALDVPDTATVTQDDTTLLNAVAQDGSYQINVTATQDDNSQDVFNYKYLTADDINNMVEGKKQTAGVTNAVFLEQANDILITYYAVSPDTGAAMACAETVVNGSLVSVSMTVAGNELSMVQKDIFNDLLDSLQITKLTNKPLVVNVAEILFFALFVLLVCVVIVGIILLVYYRKNGNPSMSFLDMPVPNKRRKEAASQYYDELKSDGILGETTQFDKVGGKAKADKRKENASAATVEKAVKESPLNKDEWKQMSLSSNEWAEKNAEDIKAEQPYKTEAVSPVVGSGPLFKGPMEKIDGAKITENESHVELSRNNNDDFDEYMDDETVTENPVNTAKEYAMVFFGKRTVDRSGEKSAEAVPKASPEKVKAEYQPERIVQPKPVVQSQEDKTVAKSANSSQGCTTKKIGEDQIQGKLQPKRSERTTPRREAPEKVKKDHVVTSFEQDSYWDKYR
ncbi:MAG TPA: hypothetical protein GX401_04725 [Clostridiales bacterium]|nr:hypothetical protein [Clostridiales bacterium]